MFDSEFDDHPIVEAIRHNEQRTLQQLLENTPKLADDLKRTALERAASQTFMACLHILLEYNNHSIINVDAQIREGSTASHLEKFDSCEEYVRKLLQNVSDSRVTMVEIYSALYLAVRTKNFKMVEPLLNNPEIVNLEYRDCWGRSLLHLSAGCGHLDITRILLENGADPQLTDYDYRLPVYCTFYNKHFDIAHLLIRSDLTTVNHEANYLITPLMLAANCDSEGAYLLLENGARVDICSSEGVTALHFAASSGNAELLHFMLQSTDASCVEKCIMDMIQRKGDSRDSISSLTCSAIDSENVQCLKVLTSSTLSKNCLQIPSIRNGYNVESPLAYVFQKFCKPNDDNLDAFLQLLLKYKLTVVPDIFSPTTGGWHYSDICRFHHPFWYIMFSKLPLSQKQYYLNLLHANGVTVDYCLQFYHDNSQSFSSFTNYKQFYEPMLLVRHGDRLKVLKLLMSNSAILEPDLVITKSLHSSFFTEDNGAFQYLISLKPVYLLKLFHDRYLIPKEYSFNEEFSKTTLQQLCRTVIRHHLRDYTLEGNLRNFRRKIMELPLPTLLKDYLLFKY